MNNYTLTQEDLDENPLLDSLGYSIGDEIENKNGGMHTNGGSAPVGGDPNPGGPGH